MASFISQWTIHTSGVGRCRTDVVEIFNLSTFTYEQRRLTNTPTPEGLDSMAVTWDESHGYCFGGEDDQRKKLNSIYCLDFSTLECREILPAAASATPSPRADCRMIHFNRKLVVYGGRTGSSRVSSDLLLFDLENSKYCRMIISILCLYNNVHLWLARL